MGQDERYLDLLSIFHYVVAGISALAASIPICHLAMGIVMVIASLTDAGEGAPPAFMGVLFAVFGGAAVLAGWALAICIALAGRFLAKRRHYMFCLVVAGVECLIMPYGTVLGVFSLITLVRPTVENLFTGKAETATID